METFYDTIRSILIAARQQTYRQINESMVKAYWHIGRRIMEEEQHGQQRAGYGLQLIPDLASRLTDEFGPGFDKRNLFMMRQFYLAFPIVNTLRSELTWSHYRRLTRLEDSVARTWYMNEAASQNWSSRALDRQINVLYYERLLSSTEPTGLRAEATEHTRKLEPTPLDFVRDPYVLDFLQLQANPKLYERDLEQGLLDNIQAFLLELGKGFAFVARQQRLNAGDDEFRVDLVFYNFILKCFVLIDLKIGKLTHQDIGQLDMYVRMYDELHRQPGDNPTVGLILCSEKNDTVVRYSVLNDRQQLFASRYVLYLPSEEQLKAEIERDRRILEQHLHENTGQSDEPTPPTNP